MEKALGLRIPLRGHHEGRGPKATRAVAGEVDGLALNIGQAEWLVGLLLGKRGPPPLVWIGAEKLFSEGDPACAAAAWRARIHQELR